MFELRDFCCYFFWKVSRRLLNTFVCYYSYYPSASRHFFKNIREREREHSNLQSSYFIIKSFQWDIEREFPFQQRERERERERDSVFHTQYTIVSF